MTGLLLLLASATAPAPQGEPAVMPPSISEAEAIGRAKAKAALLGVKVVGQPTATTVRRDHEEVWRVDLAPVLSRPAAVFAEISARDGHLVGFGDSTFAATPVLPGWSPRLARPSARSRAVTVGRRLGVPPTWPVASSSFEARAAHKWPASAEIAFEERPLGYPYLDAGNRALLSLNPRTGALTRYILIEEYSFQRAAIRLRADQAAALARKWRLTERNDARPRVQGTVRLGWATPDPENHVARLVYEVPFLVESQLVDANNGRIIGSLPYGRARNRG